MAEDKILEFSYKFLHLYLLIYDETQNKDKVKQSLYTPWKRLGGEEV
jgi:hypothetical protein